MKKMISLFTRPSFFSTERYTWSYCLCREPTDANDFASSVIGHQAQGMKPTADQGTYLEQKKHVSVFGGTSQMVADRLRKSSELTSSHHVNTSVSVRMIAALLLQQSLLRW